MSITKALKYVGVIILLYFVFCFALAGVSMLFPSHDDSDDLIDDYNFSSKKSASSGDRSDYSTNDRSSYSSSSSSSSHSMNDEDWWYEEYGDYYNSAEAEDMGYYDYEDYLD